MERAACQPLNLSNYSGILFEKKTAVGFQSTSNIDNGVTAQELSLLQKVDTSNYVLFSQSTVILPHVRVMT
jgi:hypothetical protein